MWEGEIQVISIFSICKIKENACCKRKWAGAAMPPTHPDATFLSAMEYSHDRNFDSSMNPRKIMYETYYGARSCLTIQATASLDPKVWLNAAI